MKLFKIIAAALPAITLLSCVAQAHAQDVSIPPPAQVQYVPTDVEVCQVLLYEADRNNWTTEQFVTALANYAANSGLTDHEAEVLGATCLGYLAAWVDAITAYGIPGRVS